MARYTTTFRSNRSIEETFAYFSDFVNALEWDPSVRSAQRSDDGPIVVGSEFLLDAVFAGRVQHLTYSVTAIELLHRVVFEAAIPFGRSVDTITFAPVLGGCRVTYDAQLQLRGAFKLLEPVMALLFRRTGNRARVGMIEVLA